MIILYPIWKGFHLTNTAKARVIFTTRLALFYMLVHISTSYHNYFVDAAIIPVLQKQKLSPREILTCVWPHGQYRENSRPKSRCV